MMVLNKMRRKATKVGIMVDTVLQLITIVTLFQVQIECYQNDLFFSRNTINNDVPLMISISVREVFKGVTGQSLETVYWSFLLLLCLMCERILRLCDHFCILTNSVPLTHTVHGTMCV